MASLNGSEDSRAGRATGTVGAKLISTSLLLDDPEDQPLRPQGAAPVMVVGSLRGADCACRWCRCREECLQAFRIFMQIWCRRRFSARLRRSCLISAMVLHGLSAKAHESPCRSSNVA